MSEEQVQSNEDLASWTNPLTSHFYQVYTSISQQIISVQKSLLKDMYVKNRPPPEFVDLSILKAVHFKVFALGYHTHSGEEPTFDSIKSKRSAFRYFWTLMRARIPDDDPLTLFMKGYKHEEARRNAESGRRVDQAKEPLKFECYKTIASSLIKKSINSGDDYLYVFTHTYLLLQWNTLARNETLQKLSLECIRWSDDSLQIFYLKMKNDQEGDQSNKPKHIYANPLQPEICPVLSLAIFLSVIRLDPSSSLIFQGASLDSEGQDQRYSRALKNVLMDNTTQIELLANGFDPRKFGTHSVRKGATTYLSTGCSRPPPQASIDLRGGWAQGGVRDAYHHYSAPGDQYVGRVVSGLPCVSPDFAILPPHFINFPALSLLSIVKQVFPTIPQELSQVGIFCLASLIHHWDWIQVNLPPGHILFHMSNLQPQDVRELENDPSITAVNNMLVRALQDTSRIVLRGKPIMWTTIYNQLEKADRAERRAQSIFSSDNSDEN